MVNKDLVFKDFNEAKEKQKRLIPTKFTVGNRVNFNVKRPKFWHLRRANYRIIIKTPIMVDIVFRITPPEKEIEIIIMNIKFVFKSFRFQEIDIIQTAKARLEVTAKKKFEIKQTKVERQINAFVDQQVVFKSNETELILPFIKDTLEDTLKEWRPLISISIDVNKNLFSFDNLKVIINKFIKVT